MYRLSLCLQSTLLYLLLILIPRPQLGAQTASQLTSLQTEAKRPFWVNQVVAFEGRVYTANYASKYLDLPRFTVVDPSTAAEMPLLGDRGPFSGTRGDEYLGSLQVLDGKLFGRKQQGNATDIYRIIGNEAFRLTHLIKHPLTRLVKLDNRYYFLVAGRTVGSALRSRKERVYTELWQTDGTRAGTKLVAELPVVNQAEVERNIPALVAGKTGLLLSGLPVNGDHHSDREFYLYRPGSGLVQVQFPDRLPGRLRNFGIGDPEVFYFAGNFFRTGSRPGSSTREVQLYRVDETGGTMHPIPDIVTRTTGQTYESDPSYAVVGDSLYLHLVSCCHVGSVLYSAPLATPDRFRIVSEATGAAMEAGVVNHGNTLYFGGAEDGRPVIMRYIPGKRGPEVLYRSPYEVTEANLLAGDDVLYMLSKGYGRDIVRYRLSTGVADYFSNQRPYRGDDRYRGTLLADDLIYRGYFPHQDVREAESAVYRLGVDAERPQPLVATVPAASAGVDRVHAQVRNGRLLLSTGEGEEPRKFYLVDPRDTTVVRVRDPTASSTLTNPPDYLNTFGGVAYFSVYHWQDKSYALYSLRGDALEPVLDTDTSHPFASLDLAFLKQGRTEIDQSYSGQVAFHEYRLTDSTVTRVAGEYRHGETPVEFWGRDLIPVVWWADNKLHGTVLDASGSRRYNFQLDGNADLINYDSTGFYCLRDPGIGQPYLYSNLGSLRRGRAYPLPVDVWPEPGAPTYMVNDRLIFFPYDRAGGSEPHVAEPATATTARLKDIHPGPGGSQVEEILQIGDVLYFTATDGRRGSELWRTDGTTEGTYLVADIAPGPTSSAPRQLYRGRNTLFFSAYGDAGRELYGMRLDNEQVTRIADLHPGPDGSFPRSVLEVGNILYVVANPGGEVPPQLFRIEQY